jgi:hypothetical protein
MSLAPEIWSNTRVRSTPFTSRIEAYGVGAYSVYNHMLLPLKFVSVEDDYWHLKEHVQLWDVSVQRQVEISGPDAARLVQLLTPRDLTKSRVGRCYYAPLVDARGGLINDPVILKLAEDRFWLSISDSDVALWAKGLAHGFGLSVEIFEPTVDPLAVQGPKAEQLMERVFGSAIADIKFFGFSLVDFGGHDFLVARTGWSKQGGFEIYYVDRPDLAGSISGRRAVRGRDFIATSAPSARYDPDAPFRRSVISSSRDRGRASSPTAATLRRHQSTTARSVADGAPGEQLGDLPSRTGRRGRGGRGGRVSPRRFRGVVVDDGDGSVSHPSARRSDHPRPQR